MIAWIGVAIAAEVHVPWSIPLRVDAPSGRVTFGRTFTPSDRIRRPVSVTTEEGGFRLTCSGERRHVLIDLEVDAVVTAEHPRELVCTVGPDTYVLEVSLDLALAYRQEDHPALRGEHPGVMAQFARRGAADERAVVLDAAGEVEDGLACGIVKEMLDVRIVTPIEAGVYRCFFADGRAEFVDVLPSLPIR
jgi:hypothetical protein